MNLSVKYTQTFNHAFDKAFKKHPKSKDGARKFIDNELSLSPDTGDKYPGFGQEMNVRKVRIAMAEYKISKRDGARLIYLHLVEKQLLIPLFIYIKPRFQSEHKILADTKDALKKILTELSGE